MNTFDTIDELFLGAAAQLLNEGSATASRDGGVSHEVLGYTARLLDPRACFLLNPVRRASPSYAAAELLWYLSGSQLIAPMVAYAPQYVRFSDDGITAYGAYGHRLGYDPSFRHAVAQHEPELFAAWNNHQRVHGTPLRPSNQLDSIMMLLSEKSESRQAVVSLWRGSDLVNAQMGDRKDLPCTLTLQFLVRDGKLNLIVNMRSNDIWLGLPYDIWCWCNVQQLLADALGLELGWYQHQAGSLHCYERNKDRFIAAAAPESFDVGALIYATKQNRLHEDINTAVQLEEFHRLRSIVTEFPMIHTLLGQIVVMAGWKWDRNATDKIDNNILRRYMEKL
jgi:thymidylate synthase